MEMITSLAIQEIWRNRYILQGDIQKMEISSNRKTGETDI